MKPVRSTFKFGMTIEDRVYPLPQLDGASHHTLQNRMLLSTSKRLS